MGPTMATNEGRLCVRCSEFKEANLFHTRRDTSTGLSSWCKPCALEYARHRRLTNPDYRERDLANSKARNAKRREDPELLRADRERKKNDAARKRKESPLQGRLKTHHISLQTYQDKMLEQNMACGVCRKPFVLDRSLHIDHDHSCCDRAKGSCGNCFRGLLCNNCNTMLGHAKDNIAILAAGIEYLRKESLGVIQ